MEKTIVVDGVEARQLYKTATPEWKSVLEKNFGKDFFSQKITDRIKTYEDACAELGEETIDENRLAKSLLTSDEITYRKIKTITRALNEGWKADWNDSNQQKWYPWFKLSSGGFVFNDTCYGRSGACAGRASRLCFKSDELATYAGKQFLQLYSDFIK